jgi:glycosyltransferase involved in cell wall biosynthesis
VALDALLLGGVHSGVEQAIAGLVAALGVHRGGHEYLVVHRPGYELPVAGGLQSLVTPGWVRGRAARIAYQQFCLPAALKGRCDLLHAPGYVLPLGWRGPAVLTVYDLIALQFPQYCKPSNVWHYRALLPPSLRRARAIIVPSRTVAQDLGEWFPAVADKVRVIPLGIEAAFRPAAAEQVMALRRRLQLPERFLLCVGNLEPKKNLAAVVQAFDRVADKVPHDLVLAGGKSWGEGALGETLGRLRHASRVHRVGYVPAADLPSLYSAAELLIQWSLYEGQGLPPLEAMACGTPALVSDGGALPETVGEAGLVVPLGPPEALAAELLTLLNDPQTLQHLRERGRDHASAFTWERHAEAVVALYEELGDA